MGCALRLNINYPEFRRYHHNKKSFGSGNTVKQGYFGVIYLGEKILMDVKSELKIYLDTVL